MRSAVTRCPAVAVVASLAAGICAAGGRAPPLTTAQLLVDLARDHALNRAGAQSAADVLHVKTLLRAAARLDPRLVDAHAWLYELALLGGEHEEAAAVLDRLVAADPQHQGAFLRWLDAGMRTRQTVERRQEWLQQTLAAADRPPQLQAMVYIAIARLALDAMDRARARMALDRALGLDRDNPDAAMLDLEMLDDDAGSVTRLRIALRALQMNPLQAEVAWQIGALLDEVGMATEARAFYDHALEVHAATNPGRPIPPAHLMQLACSDLARGATDEALKLARQAAETEAQSVEALTFYYWLLKRSGRQADAVSIGERLAARFALIREPSQWEAAEVAQAAWYYCLIDPQPQRALMLAEAAAAKLRGDSFAARALGWAQAMNQRSDEAVRTLLPLAGKDAYSAYQLASMARAAGDEQTAIRLVQNLAFVPPAGPAADLIASLRIPRPAAEASGAARSEITELLADFGRESVGFHKQPRQYVEASVELLDPAPGPGEPWWAELALTNRADFPITLGPDWMLNPVFLLSFHVEGDRRRDYPWLLTVNLDRQRVIRPGETVLVRRTLDVGPLRRISRGTPQQLQRISIGVIVDPVQDATGQWRPAATGQQLRPTYFNRIPARVGRAELGALFAAVNSEVDADVFRALEVLAELLGERQRAELRKLTYEPERVPTDRIYQVLLAALRSNAWEVQARALESLQVVGLDTQMLQAVRNCLAHNHWCVRLMATRLIARRGADAAETLRRLADEDPDELVSDLARSYLQLAAAAPSTQPTAGDP